MNLFIKKIFKSKVREWVRDGVIKTNFLNNGLPKENTYYTCIGCITVGFCFKNEQKRLSTSLFRRV